MVVLRLFLVDGLPVAEADARYVYAAVVVQAGDAAGADATCEAGS